MSEELDVPAIYEKSDEEWIAYFSSAMRGHPNQWLEGLHDLMIWCLMRSHDRVIDEAIEVGTYAGQSTLIISKYVESLRCVDPYVANYDPSEPSIATSDMDGREHLVEEAMIRAMSGRQFNMLKMTSQEAAAIDFPPLDFVYIDGDHRYESLLLDLKLWSPKVASGGFLAGHDYYNTDSPPEPLKDVRRALLTFFGREPDAVFQDTSWVYRL